MESVTESKSSQDYIKQMLLSIKDSMEQVQDEVSGMAETLESLLVNTGQETN